MKLITDTLTGRPYDMAADVWGIIRKLPNHPTARHPMGQRYATLERAALLHFDGGLPVEEADRLALQIEADQSGL